VNADLDATPCLPPGISTRSFAVATSFRFSTKYTDGETKSQYFGHRYFQTATGSWLTRDPSGEGSGSNLYSYTRNAPIFRIDSLGLDVANPHPPPVGDPDDLLYYTPLPAEFFQPVGLNSGPCCCRRSSPPLISLSDNGSGGWDPNTGIGTYRVRVTITPPVCYRSPEWYWHTCQVGNHWGVWLNSKNQFTFEFRGRRSGSWMVDFKFRWLTCDGMQSGKWILQTTNVGFTCHMGHCD
jgi:RHS repeat-associated protein